jgi:hypothetical protein
VIHGFLEKLAEKNVHKLLPLKYLPDIIQVSSSECERRFSQMNFTVTQSWSLLTNAILALLFIRLAGYFLM